MARTVTKRKRGEGGTRRTVVAGKSAGEAPLDDRPLEIRQSRDRKRLIVTLPYEIWILDAKDLSRQRAIEVEQPRPSVAEDPDGQLWIGGRHLFRGSSWGNATSKVGSKLGGFVDRVALLRPELLCGVGHGGEVLWNTGDEKPEHRRKKTEHEVTGLVATPDERALWADGTKAAWLIDPAHPQGYTQIHFRSTSEPEVHAEGITRVGLTTTGRCILAARDGGVAWTTADMRIAKERFLAEAGRSAQPLDVTGDERWVYVLRGRGLLQRFLIEQPKPKKKEERPGRGRARPAAKEEEEEELPEALSCRLSRPADCMTLAIDAEGNKKLVFGGSTADGHLGRAWSEDPERLEWSELRLGKRRLVEPADGAGSQAPNFTPTRSKLEGPPVRDLKVDDVISGKTSYWSSTDHGVLLDRPTVPAGAPEILPGDSLLLPAMIRFKEGTARPAILVWPGVADERREVPAPTWLTWGDQSAGWVPLETPEIRKQRWSRSDLFPLQVALATPPPEAPGRRFRIPERWADPDSFAALARECKKLLKVLW